MNVRVFRNDEESVRAFDKALLFWGNALGELHCPHKEGLPDITEEELPDELKRVYQELFWEPCGDASLRYLVETEKGFGLALLNEYDGVTAETSGMDFGPLFETVIADGDSIANDKLFENCEIFAGERTGFDGCHELIVVVPYNVSIDEFKKIAEKLDDYTYFGCGLNNNQMNNEKGTRNNYGIAVGDDLNGGEGRGENKGLSMEQVDGIVSDWLQKMRMQEGELIYAKDLDIQSEEYRNMVGLVANLCLREFPDLHEAVFGDGAGTMDLIFKDKWQEGCFKLYYYNPDSSAGGLIEECPFDVVDATEMIGNKNYMDVLAEHTHYLADVNSEHFFETIFGLLEMKRDGLYLGSDVDKVCSEIEENAKTLMGTLADAQEKSVRFVTDSVVGIGDFVDDSEKKKGLHDSFLLRNKTLDVCYGIPGYELLPRDERNKLYDLVKKAVEKDMEEELDL